MQGRGREDGEGMETSLPRGTDPRSRGERSKAVERAERILVSGKGWSVKCNSSAERQQRVSREAMMESVKRGQESLSRGKGAMLSVERN